MHGGRSPGAPKGEGNGNFRHGFNTLAAREHKQDARRQVDDILRGVGEFLARSTT
jgi:hypothetical protein